MTIFNFTIPGYWILFLGILIIICVNYLHTRSEKKWLKQTSNKRSHLLDKIRSNEKVPPSEFQDYFEKTSSGKITYDGNILILTPLSFRFGTLLVLGLLLVCSFLIKLFMMGKGWLALVLIGFCLFFLIAVIFSVFRAKSLQMNMSANTYRIAYGLFRWKIKEGDLSDINKIEMYEGDEFDWMLILSLKDPFFTIRHSCFEHECIVLAEDLSQKLNIELVQSKYSDKS